MNTLPAIVGLTVSVGAATAVTGAWLLHLIRRRSFRYPVVIATSVPLVTAAAAVGTDVRFGFLHNEDLVVVVAALAASLAVAGLLSYLVIRTITSASSEVGVLVQQLVEDSTPSFSAVGASPNAAETFPLPRELARVVADLAVARNALTQIRGRERTAEQSRQELVSFMSHDLRTPLAGLRALAEGLEDGVITDLPRALSHLSSTVERMSGLVDDLFALSRVQGAPTTRQQRMVSLTEVITDVATELASTAAARKVNIDVEVPAADRLAVLGAPDDLSRALTNLVANAIRHTDPGLTVRLLGRRADEGGVQVAVIDACGGIPDKNLPHVFDTGWRGSPSPLDDHGGAGLGLAIVRGVVQSHAGEIAVRNVEGGCQFQVDLPPSNQVAVTRAAL